MPFLVTLNPQLDVNLVIYAGNSVCVAGLIPTTSTLQPTPIAQLQGCSKLYTVKAGDTYVCIHLTLMSTGEFRN